MTLRPLPPINRSAALVAAACLVGALLMPVNASANAPNDEADPPRIEVTESANPKHGDAEAIQAA